MFGAQGRKDGAARGKNRKNDEAGKVTLLHLASRPGKLEAGSCSWLESRSLLYRTLSITGLGSAG